jgi:hypothetical protein
MSDGQQSSPEMTNARAFAFALLWALCSVLFCILPILSFIPGLELPWLRVLLLTPILAFVGAYSTHRSWKVAIWAVLLSCAIIAMFPVLFFLMFTFGGGHPG